MQEERSILVVDDDPNIRAVVTRTLVGCGHSVYVARDVEDAFRTAQLPGGERIGLLITDLIMPDMDGRNLAQWMTGAYPDIKILFMSGNSEESEKVASAIRANEKATLLRKPFSPSELREAVQALLN
jgi:two-component system cell cycle sensor histidine kinase/response regulator CckA